MFLIDNALRQRAAEDNPIRVAMVGAGFMGRALANQIVNSVPGMRLCAIANRTVENAFRGWTEAGVEGAREVASLHTLEDCIRTGIPAVTGDPFLLCESQCIDILIEMTGSVEFGARFALEAFDHAKHVVTINAELEATLGSVLQAHARRAGVIFSLSDGDQPGVQLNLWRQVRSLGLQPLVCGNIKGLHDPYRTPATQKAFAEKWGQDPRMVTSFADGTKIAFEQACVANATGMRVEQRGMRGGDFDGHIDALCHSGRYDVDRLRALGGVVDYVVGARPAPGVFVLATHDDPRQQHMLNLYKLGPGPLYSFYTPYHLCHFEVPLSVARVALFGDRVLAAQRPTVEVITVAKTDLKAGQKLDGIGGYHAYGIAENVEQAAAENLLPMGLSEDCTLLRDILKDTPVRRTDVRLPSNRTADRLREEQDRTTTTEAGTRNFH